MHTQRSVDLVDVLACVLFVGLGATSIILAFWPPGGSARDVDVAELLDSVDEDRPMPDEVLMAGPGLESLVFDAFEHDFLARLPRLIDLDKPFKATRNRYWVLAFAERLPETPTGYTEEPLAEGDGLQLVEWLHEEGAHKMRLTDMIQSADAEYRADGKPTIPCTRWRFGRMKCGPNGWNWVGATDIRVNGKLEHCIWAHPLAEHELVIHFKDVLLSGTLKGRYAFADSALRAKPAHPVTIRVMVGDKERIKRVLPNKKGWNHFSIPRDRKDPPRVDLRFLVTAPHDGMRHFCFDADLLPGQG